MGKAERRYAGVTHVDVNDLGPENVRMIHDLMGSQGIGISALATTRIRSPRMPRSPA